MKKEPKILLIYPPNLLFSIETPRPDGSLGPLYLAGALERAGFETDILDASIGAEEDNLKDTFYHYVKLPNGLIRIGMSNERIRQVIAEGEYNIVGINSNFTPQTKMALEVASVAKKVNPNMLVIVGGVNSRNLPERFLDSGDVDVVCMTEGEKIIVKIVESWSKGNGFDQVTGVMYLNKNKPIFNPVDSRDIYTNLDELPFPTWNKLLFKKYDLIASSHAVLTSTGVRYAPIMTSRGCPFRCQYCHISMEKGNKTLSGDIGTLRLKSMSRVLREIDELQKLGVKKLYFEDDSLLAKKARVIEIFEHVGKMGFTIENVNGVNISHFQQRGKNGKLEIDVDYLKFLKTSGLDQVIFPIESGSQRILDKYATAKLNLSTLDTINLVNITAKIGISCPVNMMIGFPDETEEEMFQSIELGKKLIDAGAPYCTFFIPIPFPGSRLFEIAVTGGYLDKNFDPDMMNWKNAVMKNTIVPPDRIVEIRDSAWKSINNEKYTAFRLKESIGTRWQSNH